MLDLPWTRDAFVRGAQRVTAPAALALVIAWGSILSAQVTPGNPRAQPLPAAQGFVPPGTGTAVPPPPPPGCLGQVCYLGPGDTVPPQPTFLYSSHWVECQPFSCGTSWSLKPKVQKLKWPQQLPWMLECWSYVLEVKVKDLVAACNQGTNCLRIDLGCAGGVKDIVAINPSSTAGPSITTFPWAQGCVSVPSFCIAINNCAYVSSLAANPAYQPNTVVLVLLIPCCWSCDYVIPGPIDVQGRGGTFADRLPELEPLVFGMGVVGGRIELDMQANEVALVLGLPVGGAGDVVSLGWVASDGRGRASLDGGDADLEGLAFEVLRLERERGAAATVGESRVFRVQGPGELSGAILVTPTPASHEVYLVTYGDGQTGVLSPPSEGWGADVVLTIREALSATRL